MLSRLVSGVRRPRQPILGTEFAGEVEAVGAAVNEFAVGDHVFGSTGFRFGAYAEYICVPQSSRVAHMAMGMSFEEGAAICDGGLNALWCLRQADIQKGQRYLVYGASGAIGTAAVQLAKHFGTDVTAVCSTKNLELMRTLGADRAIDYTKEDFTRNGEKYDVILDAVGKHSFKRCKGSLKAGGKYLATDGLKNLLLAFWTPRFADKEVIFSIQFTTDPLTTGVGNELHLYWGYPYDLEPGMVRDLLNDRQMLRDPRRPRARRRLVRRAPWSLHFHGLRFF